MVLLERKAFSLAAVNQKMFKGASIKNCFKPQSSLIFVNFSLSCKVMISVETEEEAYGLPTQSKFFVEIIRK